MAEQGAKLTRAEVERRYERGDRDFREIDLAGVDLSGIDLSRADLYGSNLRHTILDGANLCEAKLRRAEMEGAVLREARLVAARLDMANLSGANLSDASINGAQLTGTILKGATLARANIRNAHFLGNVFSGTRLGGAKCWETVFANVDLSAALDVASIEHWGPSTVGIDTILRSCGKIPDVFLRGCGLPEGVIEFQNSLVHSIAPIHFHSSFISYSHKDEEFAHRLHGRLQEAGLRVWFAPEELRAGRKLHEQVDDAIRVHDKLLLVLSAASMASEWVATEISKARKRERKEGRQVLFPIRLVDFEAIRDWECFDADAGKDSAREVREYFIPDFSQWKDHDAFEAAFSRLLKDLRASAKPG